MRQTSLWMFGFVSVLLLTSRAAHAEWRDWWWTQEQRAQQALEAGRAAQAASLFSDPERRAHAEIKAGQYQAAAERLASLGAPEAQYNRGNALARAGDLRGALAAYDAALARSAKGSATARDARHNRDLVARQLQKQQREQQKQQPPSANEQQKNDGSGENAEAAPQENPPSGEERAGQASSADQKPSADESNRQGDSADSSAAPTQDAKRADEEAKSKEARAQDEQAARAEEERSRAASGTSTDQRQPPRASRRDTQATSERDIAVEQWLRQIPEDPGGLLRRKFLLEHRRKQREARP